MYIDSQMIISFVALMTSLVTVIGAILGAYKWYLKQEKQDADINAIKEEQCLLTYGVLACLKGLKEQGCNGSVTLAIDKIEKHVNLEAHK